MTIEELGACLQQTINENNRLILPGMGVLYSKDTAPQFIKNGNALTPPSRKLFFTAIVDSKGNTDIQNGEELNPIASIYSKERNIEYAKALGELEELCNQTFNTLESQAYVTIPDFGTIRYGSGLDFVFEPHPSIEFNIQNWGLDIICAKKISAAPVKKEPAKEQTHAVSTSKAEHSSSNIKRQETAKHTGNKTTQQILLAILIIFLLFVTAMFIFKDTFMPLWEQLLYSPEELQYLNSLK